tara:strand:+ start:671 stop:919 length:249 start_codon:yes stop_codon:yes gene_type:complete
MLQSGYIYKKLVEIEKREPIRVNIPISRDLQELPTYSKLRDTQIMQAILMTHHQLGIHEPGSQSMCPMCKDSETKTITVENN